MSRDMAGKTVVVTGASSGIGKQTAMELAARGAAVVLVCRSRERGEAAMADIKARTPDADLRLFLADLGVQAQVRRVASELLVALPRIDVLVNNAGTLMGRRQLTADGHETTFAVNHLAYFLLTKLLLPRLEASAPARIINVASAMHRWGHLDFDDLMYERRYNMGGAYSRSKLANVLFTRELARRLEGKRVVANCLHPGGVSTGINGQATWWFRAFMNLARPFLLSGDEGADTVIWLATAAEAGEVSGEYFRKRRPARTSDEARDMAVAARLWTVSEQLTAAA
jgi:NAD(P)-dependent dehydrogenase (short-subunit alcohol dehydrogenase family)